MQMFGVVWGSERGFWGLKSSFLTLEEGFGRDGEGFFLCSSSDSVPEWGGHSTLGSTKAADPKVAEFWGAAPYQVHGTEILGGFFFFFFLRCWAEFKPSMDMDPLSLPPGSFSYTWVQGVDISITRLQWDYCHLPSFLHL